MTAQNTLHTFVPTTLQNATDLVLTFHWLKDENNKDIGFLASGCSASSEVDFYENVYASNEAEFLEKYPTLEHILFAMSANDAWSSYSKDAKAITFTAIQNNAGLYNLPEVAPTIQYGSSINNTHLDVDNGIYTVGEAHQFNEEEINELLEGNEDCLQVNAAVTILKTALRDGTPDGFIIQSIFADNVVITDMMYFNDIGTLLKEAPTLNDLARVLTNHPARTPSFGEGILLYITSLNNNMNLYCLDEVPHY